MFSGEAPNTNLTIFGFDGIRDRTHNLVIPVYKDHSREPENVPLCTVALYTQVKIICTIH